MPDTSLTVLVLEIGYFVIVLAAGSGIFVLSQNGRDKGALLLAGMLVVVTVLTLVAWREKIPEGAMGLLGSIAGYIFGAVSKRSEQSEPRDKTIPADASN